MWIRYQIEPSQLHLLSRHFFHERCPCSCLQTIAILLAPLDESVYLTSPDFELRIACPSPNVPKDGSHHSGSISRTPSLTAWRCCKAAHGMARAL